MVSFPQQPVLLPLIAEPYYDEYGNWVDDGTGTGYYDPGSGTGSYDSGTGYTDPRTGSYDTGMDFNDTISYDTTYDPGSPDPATYDPGSTYSDPSLVFSADGRRYGRRWDQ